VRDEAADHRAEIFAANRARGRIALAVASSGALAPGGGATQPVRIAEEGSLRVRFPGARARGLEAVILNTAGGIAGGDSFDIAIAVEEGACLAVTTAAAEKVYRTLGPAACIDLR
jgi:urease accessory protein